MAMCRACLTTEMDLILMDTQFAERYNLLTGICLSLVDNNLYACRTCWNTVEAFVEFRGKCIESDLRFQNDLNSVEKIKLENELPLENKNCLLQDIKQEEITLDCFPTNEDDDDYCPEIEQDEIVRNKLTRKKKKNTSSEKKVKKTKVESKKINKIDKSESLTGCDSKVHCGLCEEKFDERSKMIKHLEHHKSLFDTQVSCGLCAERFLNLPHMLGHRLEHVPRPQKTCHMCLRKFHSSSATCLEFHYMRAHGMAEKDAPIQCKQCPSSYPSSRKLIRHVRNCHAAPRYECTTCGQGFRNTTLLKLHTRMKHTEVEKTMKCEHCEFTSKYANSLTLHIQRKHTAGLTRCAACCRVFAHEAARARHAARCAHRAYIVCAVCGRSVKKIWLKHHMRSHSDEFPYACPQCPAKYKYRTGLKDHSVKHEGTLNHHCELCAKSFGLKSALQSHLKTHTAGKPYVCKICGTGFKRRYNLKVHMAAHLWPTSSQKHEDVA